MEGYVGDTPNTNPNLAIQHQQGGHLAPDLTHARMQMNLTDSLASSDASLINTKGDDPTRQDTLPAMLSAPMTLPDGSPIKEVSVDQLFEGVKITDEEREQERERLLKDCTTPTQRLLIRYLESYGGPDGIPVNAEPPEEGFPPGVSVTALRAELGHDLWALRHVLYALPTFTAPARKIANVLNGAMKEHRRPPQFHKDRVLADANAIRESVEENTDTHHLFSIIHDATPKLSILSAMLFTLGNHHKPPVEPVFRQAMMWVTQLAIAAMEIEAGPEGLAWSYALEKRVTSAFEPIYRYLNETVLTLPDYEELGPIVTLVAPVLLSVAFQMITTCNTPVGAPSKSQPTAIAAMVIELSNGVYSLVRKLTGLVHADKTRAELAATVLSTIVLLAGKELGGPNTFDDLPPRLLKQVAAARAFDRFTDTTSERYKATSKLSRDLASLFEQYKIEMSKYEHQTPLAFLQCTEELLLPLLGITDPDALPRAILTITEMLPEWYSVVNPMAEEGAPSELFGTLAG